MSAYSIDDIVSGYIKIRDEKRALERKHEEEIKPLNERLDILERAFLARMEQDGVDSYKTKFGTAYKSVKTSASIADANAFKEFVFSPVVNAIGKVLNNVGVPQMDAAIKETILQSALWSIVDFRALKSGVEAFIEDNNTIPNGLNVTRTTTVGVRAK